MRQIPTHLDMLFGNMFRRLQLTVSSAMWLSCWSTYAAVRCTTNSLVL